MKQAQSMGVNLVILTAIALLVLIIVAVVISDSSNNLQEGMDRCEVRGGQCSADANGRSVLGEDGVPYRCDDPTHTCYSIT